ncbi:MAG: divalent-cation tolerance protein CutA [Verrucomicrobia bacterium]|nr:divalent-cation tolerance protein CutA [Verrucomicrobiota bacterium]
MSDFIVVLWTSGSLEEARAIASYLVESQVIACASIIPQVESIFHWEGKIQSAAEVKVFLKTKIQRFEELRNIILEKCSYEVPEILALPVVAGNKSYLEWIDKSVR